MSATTAKRKPRKPFSRKGLHKLVCEMCDGFAYSTIMQLEAKGMPACGWCGEPMVPERIELAIMLGAEDAPVYRAYADRVNSVMHGQASHVAKGRKLESPEFRALFGDPKDRKRDPGLIELQRRQARERQCAALNPVVVEAMPF